MSKKKKKKNKLKQFPDHIKQQIEETADKTERYAEYAYNYGIFSGKKKEDVERAVEIVKKNMKKLRKGKLDKVLSEKGVEILMGDMD